MHSRITRGEESSATALTSLHADPLLGLLLAAVCQRRDSVRCQEARDLLGVREPPSILDGMPCARQRRTIRADTL